MRVFRIGARKNRFLAGGLRLSPEIFFDRRNDARKKKRDDKSRRSSRKRELSINDRGVKTPLSALNPASSV
jgi:hypothetical protein